MADLPRFRLLETLAPTIPFEGLFGEKGKPYVANKHLVHAANTALTLGMPLLVTGEPGCGKSDFAWAVANALGHAWADPDPRRRKGPPQTCYVRSDTRARDLLYHYDALRRFGDAQGEQKAAAADPRNYIHLQPLGVALAQPFEVIENAQGAPSQVRPAVVLIDEIDKAPRDLPNDLLQEIDRKEFEITEIVERDDDGQDRVADPRTKIPLQRKMERFPDVRDPAVRARRAKIPSPFVIITSNAERHLPEPFLRRCVFFQIPPPDELELIKIAEAYFSGDQDGKLKLRTLLPKIVVSLRVRKDITKKPSTAEMLRWMEVVLGHYDRVDVEREFAPFAEALGGDARVLPASGKAQWHDLPGLGCLIKLGEDWGKLAPRAR